MTDLTYVVRIYHKEKGLGFSAKAALQNAQKREHSVVKQAKFLGQPTGSKTEIEVIIDDSPMHKMIIGIIDTSGQMTRKDGFYSIDDITLVIKEREHIKDLQQQCSSLEQQLSLVREENTGLHYEIDTNRMEVNTALKGLLAYFKTTGYVPETLLEDEVDLGFARIMFNTKTENKFVNYVNYILNTNLSEGDIEGIFAYEIKSENEMDELRLKYETAKAELD
ncbi:hypothetical protein J4214_03245, partial [Candidatus Woesearchaeota archaeon]|nr:hypothetical protein [Candidatus Woesearchaeota archaeon]